MRWPWSEPKVEEPQKIGNTPLAPFDGQPRCESCAEQGRDRFKWEFANLSNNPSLKKHWTAIYGLVEVVVIKCKRCGCISVMQPYFKNKKQEAEASATSQEKEEK